MKARRGRYAAGTKERRLAERMRVAELAIRGQIEAAWVGIASIRQVLLPHLILPSGDTMAERASRITASVREGKTPTLAALPPPHKEPKALPGHRSLPLVQVLPPGPARPVSELQGPGDAFHCDRKGVVIRAGDCRIGLMIARTSSGPSRSKSPCRGCPDGALVEEVLEEAERAEARRRAESGEIPEAAESKMGRSLVPPRSARSSRRCCAHSPTATKRLHARGSRQGWPMADSFVPRREREANERVEAAEAAVLAALDIEADAVALAIWALVTLKREADALAHHRRAVAEVTDQLVMFDERCGAGDVVGGVVALRTWLQKVRA